MRDFRFFATWCEVHVASVTSEVLFRIDNASNHRPMERAHLQHVVPWTLPGIPDPGFMAHAAAKCKHPNNERIQAGPWPTLQSQIVTLFSSDLALAKLLGSHKEFWEPVRGASLPCWFDLLLGYGGLEACYSHTWTLSR